MAAKTRLNSDRLVTVELTGLAGSSLKVFLGNGERRRAAEPRWILWICAGGCDRRPYGSDRVTSADGRASMLSASTALAEMASDGSARMPRLTVRRAALPVPDRPPRMEYRPVPAPPRMEYRPVPAPPGGELRECEWMDAVAGRWRAYAGEEPVLFELESLFGLDSLSEPESPSGPAGPGLLPHARRIRSFTAFSRTQWTLARAVFAGLAETLARYRDA